MKHSARESGTISNSESDTSTGNWLTIDSFDNPWKQGRSQKKIEKGPNFATFNVTSFTYNGILPFVIYARRYYQNCCTKLRKCECDFTDLM